MKTTETRFGSVEYNPENVLEFPDGLIGFAQFHDFIVMPNEKDGPLFWIQSVDDPEVAFVLTDPTNLFQSYKVVPDANERETLGMTEKDECHILSMVTVHEDREVTLNLQAPILFVPSHNRAIQVILEKSPFSTREALPEVIYSDY